MHKKKKTGIRTAPHPRCPEGDYIHSLLGDFSEMMRQIQVPAPHRPAT